MCKPLSLISMLAVILLASSSVQAERTTQNCGERLMEMMDYVCESFTPVVAHKKRSMPDNDLALDPLEYVQKFEEDNSIAEPVPSQIFRGNSFERVLSSLAEIQRRTRQQGIVDRCCKHACPLAVLHEYCLVSKTY
ncbi:probable insulin-like peptide 2 [Drosophila subpulchrella]|uniref:probable insulin-like peptide 2 n=1 Tax=Drosophila subpulchrella TaxID=1486046 RepID=UPI0018A1B3A1|nr:probable insulin-like peptide 2 [Drosophila subpulchrella]